MHNLKREKALMSKKFADEKTMNLYKSVKKKKRKATEQSDRAS